LPAQLHQDRKAQKKSGQRKRKQEAYAQVLSIHVYVSLNRMKPCSVGAVKMEPRPLSAFARSKSTDLNKYMGFGLNKQELSEKTKKAEHYFMPW
jgi:hypothetical protein